MISWIGGWQEILGHPFVGLEGCHKLGLVLDGARCDVDDAEHVEIGAVAAYIGGADLDNFGGHVGLDLIGRLARLFGGHILVDHEVAPVTIEVFL